MYYVNGRSVSREGLRTKLKEELNHRMVWTVYFEADNDALTMDALYAMDVIQTLGGNVVWITPETRKEFERAGLRNADR
jgi:biopolymer transport protein ExbD